MTKTTRLWLRGMLASAINSAATSVTVALVDPAAFPFGSGKLAMVMAASAIVGAALFLQKQALPADEG